MDGLLLLALFLLGGKKKSGGADAVTQASQSDATLLARATQARALEWINTFRALGGEVSPEDAAAYARWAGIESSGNPLAVSRIGERGLFQVTATTAKNTVSPAEWAAMQSPSTSRAEHARMALAQAAIYWRRARPLIQNPPADSTSRIWYSKMWHSRPADFNGRIMHGPALAMARQLADTWKGDAGRMYRLRVANVIAFGKVAP
jgi:hypothetical protein